jgi:hypothetical protein
MADYLLPLERIDSYKREFEKSIIKRDGNVVTFRPEGLEPYHQISGYQEAAKYVLEYVNCASWRDLDHEGTLPYLIKKGLEGDSELVIGQVVDWYKNHLPKNNGKEDRNGDITAIRFKAFQQCLQDALYLFQKSLATQQNALRFVKQNLEGCSE